MIFWPSYGLKVITVLVFCDGLYVLFSVIRAVFSIADVMISDTDIVVFMVKL